MVESYIFMSKSFDTGKVSSKHFFVLFLFYFKPLFWEINITAYVAVLRPFSIVEYK